MITPNGRTVRPRPRVDSALVNALARAHRWQGMLESGECTSITGPAAAEKIDRSFLCCVLRLTLLAPDVVEEIVDAWQPEGLALRKLMKSFLVEWDRQRIQRAA